MTQSRFKDTLHLCWIYLQVKYRNLMDFVRVVIRYYPTLPFFKIDASLFLSYGFDNPFRISKEFLVLRGEEDVYTYGETPLITLDFIAKSCDLTAQDIVFELGCGRGRTCFWLHQFVGCKVIGVDFVPAFIQKAQAVQQRYQVQDVSFRLEDLFQTDLSGATVIYLYGTCYSDEEILFLMRRFTQLPQGTKVITVSYSLVEFDPSAPFRLSKQFTALFTWGIADVYLQEKWEGSEPPPIAPSL